MMRVTLVDDQDLIRTGFSLVLASEDDIEVVAEAANGNEALAWLAEHDAAVDVILMDVRMPGKNGIETTTEITERYPRVKVLVLTTFDLDEYAMLAVQAGAAGFLLKDARPTELVDAIHRVHQGDSVMAPSMTKRMVERVLMSGDNAPRETSAVKPSPETVAELAQLTEREFEVLQCIAEGLNNAEISQRMFLTESTVKTHVGRVFQKLAVRDRVHAVIYAKSLGL
ncbi:MAG: response regulator transcription factor [Microbacteriaceae bacterium]